MRIRYAPNHFRTPDDIPESVALGVQVQVPRALCPGGYPQ